MKNKRDKSKQKNVFYKIVKCILLIMSLIFLMLVYRLNLIPNKYLLIIFIVILFFDFILILSLSLKRLKKKVKKIMCLFALLVIGLLTIANFYLYRTYGVLSGNMEGKYKIENYSIIVLKSSDYTDLQSLKNSNIGYYKNSTGAAEAIKILDKKQKFKFEEYDSSSLLISDLFDKKVDAIVVEDSVKNIVQEENNEFKNSIKIIYTFKVKIKVESTLKEVDVTKEPFAIYLSGIDTYGQISSVSRSDVNIVVVVNPKSKQILLVSIPRDYYVQLHGTTGLKDKLTHAGVYGVDMSIQTIEDLLEMKINYYVKVNFTSVVDIINALGKLDVYSEYTFVSYSGYSFKKGYNTVNGEQALDFARTRKAFANGDRQRGINQQALIEAIIRKASNKSIITKYNSLLSAIDGKYQTNMSMKKITSLIKMQLNDMSPWNITSYSLTGKDSYNYTYTYNQKLYVMEPDRGSVEEATKLINSVLNGEKLESSYGEVSQNTNSVTKVDTPKKSTISKDSNDKKNDNVVAKKSSNADLKTLNIKNYNIKFNKNVKEYQLKVQENINSLEIEVETDDSSATYKIVGAKNLKANNYNVEIIVTAEDGSNETYIIKVTIEDSDNQGSNNSEEETEDENLENILIPS